MRFLINADRKVIRKGEYVKANDNAGEFVYVTGSEGEVENMGPASVDLLKDVAKANKLTIARGLRRRDEIVAFLDEELEKMSNIAEQNEKPGSEQVVEVVQAGFAAGQDDETIMMELVQKKLVPVKSVGRVFNQVVTELGLRVRAKDIRESIFEALNATNFAPETAEELRENVEKLSETLSTETHVVDAKQVMSYVRKWAKDNSVTLPSLPRGRKGSGVSGWRARIFDFILNSPEATAADVEAKMAEMERPEAATKRMVEIHALVHAYAERHAS